MGREFPDGTPNFDDVEEMPAQKLTVLVLRTKRVYRGKVKLSGMEYA